MRCTNRIFFTFAVFGLALGCDAPDDTTTEDRSSDDPPLSDASNLLDGLPLNEDLPFDIKADGPPPSVDNQLVALQSEVKSQASRGVCSIFSSVGLMEHLYIVAGAEEPDFSEQFLQWSVKARLGAFANTEGSNDYYNLRAVHQYGIPAETAWPYQGTPWDGTNDPECAGEEDNKPTKCYTNGAPPQSALDSEMFHLPANHAVNTSREAIIDYIRTAGTGVVVGMKFFYQSWNHRKSELPRNLDYWDQGYVLYPNAEDEEIGLEKNAGHAILLVGWDLDLEVPIMDAEGNQVLDGNGDPIVEKGFFIFKNSWGQQGFGIDNPHGPGYGYISMRYIEVWGRAQTASPPDLGINPDNDPDDDDGGPVMGDSFSSDEIVPIPDNAPQGVTSTIEVPEGTAVARVRITANITHTWRGDLSVELTKDGTAVNLHHLTGGGQPNLELDTTVDGFSGQSRAGTWTLRVADLANADTGQLEGWTITFE